MNKFHHSLFALLGFAATLAPMAPAALAAPPPDVFKDADGNVYIHGTTAAGLGSNARATTSEPLVRNTRAGFCGEIRLSTSSTVPSIGDSWTLGGTTRTRAALVSITDDSLLPNCRNASWSPALTAAISSAGGFVDNTPGGGGRVTLVGNSAGVSVPVAYNDVNATQNIRPNACGFVRIGNTASNPVPSTLTINGTAYTVASLTTAIPPLCRSGEMYTPASWN